MVRFVTPLYLSFVIICISPVVGSCSVVKLSWVSLAFSVVSVIIVNSYAYIRTYVLVGKYLEDHTKSLLNFVFCTG